MGDRRLSLGEARRVLRPGGVLLAAGFSRFAPVLDGVREGFLAGPAFAAIVDRDLADGRHRNPTGRFEHFTDTFFHHPDALRDEVGGAGFEVSGVLGLEGSGRLARDSDAWWDEPERRVRRLPVARRLGSEPSLPGLGAHLPAAARRA